MTKQATVNWQRELEANYPPDKYSDLFRLYQTGYEAYFNFMPVLKPGPSFKKDLFYSKNLLDAVRQLVAQSKWIEENFPQEDQRDRITIAIEHISDYDWAGAQIVIGRWGAKYKSAIHGHGAGLTYEAVISGKLINRSFRLVSYNKVELIDEKVLGPGDVIVADYSTAPGLNNFIHELVMIEPSTTIHYLAEYKRNWLLKAVPFVEMESIS